MRRLALAALLLAIAPAAEARVAPNPDGRLLLDPNSNAVLRLGRFALNPAPRAASATAVAAPLPAGAVALDSTWYDLQDMGSLGSHIAIGADGRVHVTYQKDFCEIAAGGCPPNPNLPQPFPQRGMGYVVRETNGSWTHVGKVNDPDLAALRCCALPEEFGGFGSLGLTPDGRAVVAQHLNEESCDLRGSFYVQDALGGATWTAKLPPFASGDSYLFPQVSANPNGSYTLLGEVPIGGSYEETQRFGISYFPPGTGVYACFAFQGQAWKTIDSPALYRDGRPAFPVIAGASNGRVGVAVTDFGGNVTLIESSDGTFNAGTVTTRVLTGYTDAAVVKADSTSTEWRAYLHCHLAYNDTTPNVVWSELQARRVGGVVQYFDWRGRIRHWDPVHGVTTVKQVQPGEADKFDDVDRGLAGPLCGFNTLAVDWPEVGFSEDGTETYVVWLRASDNEIDPTADMQLPGIVTGVAFMDIAASVRRGGGAWSPAQNLTNTPSTDERFVSLAARNAAGKAHLTFQASATNEAGGVTIGDRGATAGLLVRRIAYLEKTLGASLVDVAEGPAGTPAARLASWPNPARGRVHFRADARAGGNTVEVFGPDGRRVARIALGRNFEADWDGRDASGRPAPAGVYLARVTGGGVMGSTKFLLLH